MKRGLRNFKAKQTTDFAGKNAKLTVSGEVETRRSNERVSLKKGQQGIVPEIFIVDVVIDASGPGNDVMDWAKVNQAFDITENQFSQVTILAEENSLTINVEKILS